jgi:putative endonuclease
MKRGYIYIMTNKRNGTLYVGVTSNLLKRIFEHREKIVEGFSKKYNLDKLVYYEVAQSIDVAIQREKQIKNWTRKWKLNLIEKKNPYWDDLYDQINE